MRYENEFISSFTNNFKYINYLVKTQFEIYEYPNFGYFSQGTNNSRIVYKAEIS